MDQPFGGELAFVCLTDPPLPSQTSEKDDFSRALQGPRLISALITRFDKQVLLLLCADENRSNMRLYGAVCVCGSAERKLMPCAQLQLPTVSSVHHCTSTIASDCFHYYFHRCASWWNPERKDKNDESLPHALFGTAPRWSKQQ